MECVKSTSFLALVEGSPTNIFHATRGIPQGDPMSLLFAVVLEFLSQRLIEAKNQKRIDVYKMVEDHLAFADDVVLFYRVNEKSFKAIREILEGFRDFSGIEINSTKSVVVFSKFVVNRDELVAILGFPDVSLPITHLSVSIITIQKVLVVDMCNTGIARV